MAEPLAGMVLDERWELEARIASGSYASVYRAVDRATGAPRAVKILTEVVTDDAERRFRNEFETIARLHHPCIVVGHTVGTLDGRPYMVLDLMEGNVSALLDDGPLPLERAARIGVQVLAGLGAAHALGVIHRDVKPGNVLVDAEGGVRLCDFGIARVADSRMTQLGVSLGTLLYMAPEQRVDAHTVDLTADLYGVACLVYRLLTDASPTDLFTADEGAGRWADVPESVRSVLLRATRVQPKDRYPTARAMAEALLAALPDAERAAVAALPGCAPETFAEPDPRVCVGSGEDEPTAPGPPRRKTRGAAPPAGSPPAGAPPSASPSSAIPWRVAVGIALLLGVFAWAIWR